MRDVEGAFALHRRGRRRGDELFRQAKRRAADEHSALREIVEAALRQYLGKRARGERFKLKWRTESGRMLPGVRLDDRDALFDLMDGRS